MAAEKGLSIWCVILFCVFSLSAGCSGTSGETEGTENQNGVSENDNGQTGSPTGSVITLSAGDIGANSATLRGLLEESGTSESIEVGVCWRADVEDSRDSCRSAGSVEEDEEFLAEATGLEPETDYVYQAYAETEEGGEAVRSYGDQQQFTTLAGAPEPVEGVAASDGTSQSHVLVEWDGVEKAVSYRMLRDGQPVGEVEDDGSDGYSFEDTGAEPGEAPSAPTGLEVVETSASVELQWQPAEVAAGTEHTYAVEAVGEGGAASMSPKDVGWRGAATVEGYEVRRSTDGETWSEWSEVSDAEGLTYVDDEAPSGQIVPGAAAASDGTRPDYVELHTDEVSTESGSEVSYEVRAVNAIGVGEVAETVGRRRVGDEITYTWESSPGGADYSEVAACDGSRTCQDTDAAADGTSYTYQVVVSAEGADDVVVDAGEGYRAVLDLAFVAQPPTEVVAGEAFGAEVALVNQDGYRVELDGIDVQLNVNQNGLAEGASGQVTTDASGVAVFDALAIEVADTGYAVEATSTDGYLEDVVSRSTSSPTPYRPIRPRSTPSNRR